MSLNCSFVQLFQSKIEYDRLIALIGKKLPAEAGIKVRWRGGGISLAQRRDFIQQLQSLTGDGPSLPLELNPKEFQGFHLAMLNKVKPPRVLGSTGCFPACLGGQTTLFLT